MSKGISPLIIAAGAGAAYLLFTRAGTPGQAPATAINPIFNPAAGQPAQLTGINSGIKGSNGTYYTVSNYDTLARAVPALLNPNYILTAQERAQYVANYLDLQQALPTWIGYKQPDGSTPRTVAEAAQVHWTFGGCGQKRIFLPLNPPSNANQIPPPAVAKSGGGGWFSDALSIATKVVPLLLAGTGAKELTDADLQLLYTGGYMINSLLPFFAAAEPGTVHAIETRFNEITTAYL